MDTDKVIGYPFQHTPDRYSSGAEHHLYDWDILICTKCGKIRRIQKYREPKNEFISSPGCFPNLDFVSIRIKEIENSGYSIIKDFQPIFLIQSLW